MTIDEIRQTYEDLSTYEAFEVFENNNISEKKLLKALGDNVNKYYQMYRYKNIK